MHMHSFTIKLDNYICWHWWTVWRCLTPNRPYQAAHRAGCQVWPCTNCV